MFWACRRGHLDILKQLLNRGAQVNARDKVRAQARGSPMLSGGRDAAVPACGVTDAPRCSLRSGAHPCTWPCARGTAPAWSTSLPAGPASTRRTRSASGHQRLGMLTPGAGD